MQAPTHHFMSALNDTPSNSDTLVCKPTKWFFWRALMMLLMFVVFIVLFLQDGITGYREKNLQYYLYENFQNAGMEFQRMQDAGGFSESQWEEYASNAKCSFPDDAQDIMPRGTDFEMAWPASLARNYEMLSLKGGQNGAIKLWEEYAAERKWDAAPIDQPMHAGKIREQFYAAGVTGLLALTTLYFLVRTMRRNIRVDNEALYAQDGRRVPYGDMIRVDKRNWETKGLALIYYMDGEVEKKVKLDGMVYGQFKEENGAPAEQLLRHVMKHFKGEVIEYVDDNEIASDELDSVDHPAGETTETN